MASIWSIRCEPHGLIVQPLCLDQPGTSSRIPDGASQVPRRLGVVVRTLPTGSVTSRNPSPRSRMSFEGTAASHGDAGAL